MDKKVALVTNVGELAGLATAYALMRDGMTVACQDARFVDPAEREQFEADNPGLLASPEQDPGAVVAWLLGTLGRIDVLFSNDVFPTGPRPVEEVTDEQFRTTIEVLMMTPFAYCRAVVPHMKARRSGNIIFLTSAAPLGPYAYFSVYTAARAGSATLATALSRELALHNVSINAIQSNFLDSENYFPASMFREGTAGGDYLKASVPLQRMGRQTEMAELVAFLASGKCDFVTGQLIPFTGGWPNAAGIPAEVTAAAEVSGAVPQFTRRPMPRFEPGR